MREKMANERILVVDDEESICRLCSLELQKLNLSVDWTTSPLKALDKLRQTHYDLVLTDIKMPQMSGIELMKQVHQLDPGIPVVIMTAYASYEITLQALQQGAANFINKPFHRDEFRFTL
ncbi:MAG: response regulator, partial [Calditrichaeota bacterium]